MTTLFLLLVLAVSLVAVGAFRIGGLRWLWLLCALALLAVILLSLLLLAVYSVPSAWLVILYLLAICGTSDPVRYRLSHASKRLYEGALASARCGVCWERDRA
jgi:hypothetical protein